MKSYLIECAEINYFTIEVDAQSEDEAIELAREDINSFEVFDELDQVTEIALEALARERGITPEVFQLETQIIMESVL